MTHLLSWLGKYVDSHIENEIMKNNSVGRHDVMKMINGYRRRSRSGMNNKYTTDRQTLHETNNV